MDGRVHQIASIDRGDLVSAAGAIAEVVILAELRRQKAVFHPPILAVHERRSDDVIGGADIEPPLPPVSEAHGAVAGDGLTAFMESLKLICQAPGRRVIVIVPVSDNTSPGEFTSAISFVPNLKPAIEVNESNSFILRNEIPYVLAVRQDQQFPVRMRLVLEARYCFREPLAPVSRRANTRHESH